MFLFRVVFGSRDRSDSNEPIQPPTWIDRGDITDLDWRPIEGTNMTTAVLLNWSRLDSLKDIVEHLYPHVMFKEIMIRNNKVDIHIEEKVKNPFARKDGQIKTKALKHTDTLYNG